MIALVIIVPIAAAVIWGVVTHNRLVSLGNACDNAEQRVATQLQRRFDLIPNLIETVKGYARHESGTLRSVIVARSAGRAALAIGDTADAVKADDSMTRSLGVTLNAIAESYPDLKADKGFLSLQSELTSTENEVAFARQAFNDAVLAYDNAVEMFPSSVIAHLFRFETRLGFAIEDDAAKGAPKVEF